MQKGNVVAAVRISGANSRPLQPWLYEILLYYLENEIMWGSMFVFGSLIMGRNIIQQGHLQTSITQILYTTIVYGLGIFTGYN